MSAAQIQLAAARDVFLSGKPEKTFFEGKYAPPKNKLSQTYEYPFDNPVTTFGQTGICTIPKKGDTVTGVTLKVTLPQIYTPISETMYVYPTPSSRFDGALYVQVPVASVISTGTQLTIKTINPTTANVGDSFSLINTGLYDNNYTVSSRTNANTFVTYAITPVGTSNIGSVSFLDVRPRDVTGYFSTQNFNLWSDDFTDVSISLVSLTGNGTTVTGVTNGAAGQDLIVGTTIVIDGAVGSGIFNGTFTILTYNSATNTFTYAASGSGAADVSNARMNSPALSIRYDPVLNKFQFMSVIFSSIRFVTAVDAAFWGFDFRQGPEFQFVNGSLTSQWTLVQGGWIYGYLPPGDSSYVDSVANKLIKSVRIMVGKQTINEFSGEYIELYNDLNTPYENQAIYKLLCGKYDTTQASQPRTYYVKIPLGFDSIPHLTYQNLEVQIDFEQLTNLSTFINPGVGFFDPFSYTTFNATDNIPALNGELINTIATLSFEQYILFRTKAGSIVIYDSTKNINDPASYSVISAYLYAIGESFFTDFTTLGQTLYAQAYNNYLLKGPIPDLVEGDISSFLGNDYLPTLPTQTLTNISFTESSPGLWQVNTSGNHYIRTGDTITITSASPSGLNGSYSANVITSTSYDFYANLTGPATNPGLTITKGTFVLNNTLITQFGTGVQVTTSAPHYYIPGDQIEIVGSTGYDGVHTVLYVTSSTQYTFFVQTDVYPPNVLIPPNTGVSAKQIKYADNPPNGLVTDGVYVYYAVKSNRPTTYLIRYDQSYDLYDSANGYVAIDFTANVTSANYTYSQHDILFTGNSLYVLPQEGTSNTVYIYNINSDFMDPDSWQAFDYYTLLGVNYISTGISIGNYLYFIADGYKIIQYNVLQSYSDASSYTTFDTLNQGLLPWSTIGTDWTLPGTEMPLTNLMSTGKYLYMSAGCIASNVYLSGQACIIRVDVANGLDNPESYEYYSSTGDTPFQFDFSSNTYAVTPAVTIKTPVSPIINASIVGAGTGAVVTTLTPHGLTDGMFAIIQGSTSFDSATPYPIKVQDAYTYAFGTNINVTNTAPNAGITLVTLLNKSIIGDGSNVQVTIQDLVLKDHGLSVGDIIKLSGVEPAFLNGPQIISAVPNATQFEFTSPYLAGRYIPKIFIYGPRYVYMYTNDTGTYGNTQAKDIIRYDQYTQTNTLNASLLVDFEKHDDPPPENQLIGLIQVSKSDSPLEMQLKGPVKELWFTGTPDSTNVYQYSSIIDQNSIGLTHGEEIVSQDVGTYIFYNTVQPFETHTVMPTRNFSMYSFEMDPENPVPNGTVNFSRISDQSFSNSSATVWARSYNILKVQGGVGGLLFNS